MTTGAASIFITGAASGIGRETAKRFASAGWRVGLCDIDADKVRQLARELGDAASFHPADVRDAASLASAIAQFCGDDGVLDVLFNCAGVLEMREFADSDASRLSFILDVNVKGVMNGILAALPFLQARGGARIVTMSSLAAVYGVPEEAVYAASKFAVRGLTEALNIELEARNIWVCDVMVGYVATPMVLEAEMRAKSVDIVGINVQPSQVSETVWQAATGEKRVHWFVTENDANAARKFDETPWESRREIMKSTSGY